MFFSRKLLSVLFSCIYFRKTVAASEAQLSQLHRCKCTFTTRFSCALRAMNAAAWLRPEDVTILSGIYTFLYLASLLHARTLSIFSTLPLKACKIGMCALLTEFTKVQLQAYATKIFGLKMKTIGCFGSGTDCTLVLCLVLY